MPDPITSFMREKKRIPVCYDCKHGIRKVPEPVYEPVTVGGMTVYRLKLDDKGDVVYKWVEHTDFAYCRKMRATVPKNYCWCVECEYFEY